MSCTENESGPFVVFFLPAVIGCLTILLARRWTNSQGSSTSSTAVSRRRKIIKDPLVKRPLPTVSPKMVAPANKKAGGKKVTYANDEDLVTHGKGKNKAARVAPAGGPDNKTTDKVTNKHTPPKHIPFPHIPQDGELLFEAMTFMFMLVATGLQYLNIYRTFWWLPHHENNQTMNFYLIDLHVVAVILTILFRSVIYTGIMKLLRVVVDPKDMPKAVIATRLVVMGIIGGCVGGCVYFIARKYPPIKIFYLCYPVVIYFLLFGLQIGPFLELNSNQTVFHCCSSNPDHVTAEVEAMRHDFNRRAGRILFNSIIGAYYSSFVPCCFAQSYVYYDVYGASQQVCLVWGGLCARYISQLVNATLCDTLHRAAMHLPTLHPELLTTTSESSWASSIKLWTGGTKEGVSKLKLQHAKYYLRACVPISSGSDIISELLQVVLRQHILSQRLLSAAFKTPSTFLSVFLCLQLSLITLQLCLLFSSAPWNNFLATLLLLFMNYYTLFKMVRDYMVAWKVYKAEGLIQQKHANLAFSNKMNT